ncbi:MAG TPA: hypothetical protein VFO77_07175 [Actinoplanes sp.]|nr:hypothetical protein [Actinoplanes sp.]
MTTRGAFRPAHWYTPRGLDLVDLAGRICSAEMGAALAGLTYADVFKNPSATMDLWTKLYAVNEIPIHRNRRPVRIITGTEDPLLAALSDITAKQLAAAGTDATYPRCREPTTSAS